MKANIVQPTKKVDLFTFEPELTETNELVYRFFFNDQMGKYVTLKK
jgi:hypothetical protein